MHKHVSLHCELPEDPLYVDGDAVRLEQIIGNLLNNAAKYTNENGNIWVSVQQTARTDAATDGGRAQFVEDVVIRVRDNGIGIAREKLPHVFDMFMRATRSIDERHGGLGVGLTLVRKLVELHGGRVEAHSKGAGQGSEFVVRLPLAHPEAAEVGRAPATSVVRPKPARILVVDDNPDVIEATAMSLRLVDHEVAVADSGRQALEIAAAFKPQVALIDIGMPDMDGYTLARELKASAPDGLKLIAVSGYGHAEARARAREAGFDEYLVKPASMDDINQALGRLARSGD